MKKIAILSALIQISALLFAANSENDFTYKLSADADSVIITGLKNDLKFYEIPATIEEIPVKVVEIKESLGYKNENEVTLKLPDGLKEFSLLQISGVPKGHVIITNLPSSLEKCDIRSQKNKKKPENYFITIKGSVKVLDKLNFFNAQYVEFEDKIITVKKIWRTCDFLGANFTEIQFEDGCETIFRFARCANIKKVTFPATAKKIDNEAFMFCTSLTEIIVPDSITTLDFGVNNQNFDGVVLSLKLQAKLKKLGYKGKFGNS